MNAKNDEEIMGLIKEQIGAVVGFDASDIDDNQSFMKMGISSIKTFMITNRISDQLGIDLDPTAMLEYKNIASLYQHIVEQFYQGAFAK